MAKDFCASRGGNTGAPKCDKRRGIPVMPIPGYKEFTPSEADDFQAAYEAAVLEPEGSDEKLYPFPLVQGVTNNTEANTVGTLGLGYQEVLREGKPAFEFNVVIGQCLYQALRKFNGYTGPMFIVDSEKSFWGYEKNNGNLAGYDVSSFWVSGNDFSNGTDPVNAKITFVLADPEQYHDLSTFVSLSFNIKEIKGLQNVTLSQAAVAAANVYKIAVKTVCDETNIYDAYSTALAVAGLWNAKVVTTGATLTITTVVVDAALKAFTVTFDSTAYTALASGSKIELFLDPPAQLAAGNVFGIEGNVLTITKP